MAAHVSQLTRQRYSNSVKLMQDDGSPIPEYEVVCCEMFSLAAASLASRLRVGLSEVGVLWDEIFATGRTRHQSDDRDSIEKSHMSTAKQMSGYGGDAESLAEKADVSRMEYGRGSLMMLVQHVRTRQVSEQLEALGYRFAELDQVVGIMRTSMQIKTPDLGLRLRHMASLTETDTSLSPGVHVGTFAIRARVDHTGFDVLVRKHARDLLPTVSLPMQQLESRHIGYLNHLQNQTMAVVADRLTSTASQFSELGKFATLLLDGIKDLRRTYEDGGVFDTAVLMQQTIKIPCHIRDGESGPLNATVIIFQLVLPIHNFTNIPKCTFIPLRLFKVKQLAKENSPYQLDFSHAVHRDMSSVLKTSGNTKIRDVFHRMKAKTKDSLPTSSTAQKLPKRGRHDGRGNTERSGSRARLSPGKPEDNPSLNGLSDSFSDYEHNGSSIHESPSSVEEVEMSTLSATMSPKQLFGGIMVSQEIVVETAELPGDAPKYNTDGQGHGRRKSAGVILPASSPKQTDTSSLSETRSNGQEAAAAESSPAAKSDMFSPSRHAAGAFRAEQDMERQGAMYVDQLLSLCMGKQVVI